jgi:hypothetical protein
MSLLLARLSLLPGPSSVWHDALGGPTHEDQRACAQPRPVPADTRRAGALTRSAPRRLDVPHDPKATARPGLSFARLNGLIPLAHDQPPTMQD